MTGRTNSVSIDEMRKEEELGHRMAAQQTLHSLPVAPGSFWDRLYRNVTDRVRENPDVLADGPHTNDPGARDG
tara:strand:- start:526 stop:744 length:219 start_codon:yes stop_codon:yes gene_type:complete